MNKETYDMCQKILGNNAHLLSYKETRCVLEQFNHCFPIAKEGRIDCPKMEYCADIDDIEEAPAVLSQRLSNYPSMVYVLWNSGDLPIGHVHLNEAIARFDEIAPLSFDVWLFSLEAQYVIESHHSFGLKVGINQIHTS